jgi:hypothetical protein
MRRGKGGATIPPPPRGKGSRQMDIVRVQCVDTSYNTGTWARKDIATGFGTMTLDIIGWLIDDREDCVIIASEYQLEDDQFRHLQAIPRPCIIYFQKVGTQ